MRRAAVLAGLVVLSLVAGRALADDEDEDELALLAPEARLALALAKGDVVRGAAAERYVDLLSDGDVEAWNAKRKADGHRLLDLAARTWEPKTRREDLALALEGLDLRGIDLSNVLFMPGTSFRFSDLEGASFRGSCLEGVTFSSIWGFEARSERRVSSTSLVNADLREVAWTWCAALERTAARVRGKRPKKGRSEPGRPAPGNAVRPRASEPFALVDLEGAKVDSDAPVPKADEKKTLDRLLRAAREGNLDRAIERIALRLRSARTREVPNPFKSEPLLAAAVANANSGCAGIETWKAVAIAELRAGEDLVLDRENVVLVADERTQMAARTLVVRGPVFAGRRSQLPTTFSASVIVLKDQGRPAPNALLHGEPILALSEGLRAPQRRVHDSCGTYHCAVIDEVAGVKNLSEAEADRRTLEEAVRLVDYATALGDVDPAGAPPYDPVKDATGAEPTKALTEAARRAIAGAAGKDALAGMRVVELVAPPRGGRCVVSSDPKVILVVPPNLQFHGAVYAEGPVVLAGGGRARHWLTRVASRSWVLVRGTRPRAGHLVHLGARVDVDEDEDPRVVPEEKPDAPEKKGD